VAGSSGRAATTAVVAAVCGGRAAAEDAARCGLRRTPLGDKK